jgi:hypothetical protein
VLGGLGDAHRVWWVGSVVGHGTRLEVHRAIQGSGVLCYTAV